VSSFWFLVSGLETRNWKQETGVKFFPYRACGDGNGNLEQPQGMRKMQTK